MSGQVPYGMPPDVQPKSKVWIWIGGLLTAASLLCFGLFITLMVIADSQDYHEKMFIMPGQAEWVVDVPGSYEIYYLHDALIDGKTYHTSQEPPMLDISVTNRENGQELFLSPDVFSTDAYFDQADGFQLYYVENIDAGTYQLTVELSEESDEPEPFVIGVQEELSDAMALGFFSTCCAIPVLGFPGLIILIVAIVKYTNNPALPQKWTDYSQ